MSLGLDYSGGRPSGAAIARDGYGFAMRYLDNGLSGRANLTADEVRDLQTHGVAIGLVWERKLLVGPDRATQGAPAGTADAQAAVRQAQLVGLPDNPIYFCVDFDIPDYAPGNSDARAKLGPVGDYLAAVRAVVGTERMGVYGGYWAVSRALDAGIARYAWQTAAWSGGHEDPRIHLFQRIGTVKVDNVDCDVDEARKAEFGQHSGGNDMNADDVLTLDDPAYGPKQSATVGQWITYTNAKVSILIQLLETLAPKVDALASELAALKSAQQPAISGTFSISGSGSVGTPAQGSGS